MLARHDFVLIYNDLVMQVTSLVPKWSMQLKEMTVEGVASYLTAAPPLDKDPYPLAAARRLVHMGTAGDYLFVDAVQGAFWRSNITLYKGMCSTGDLSFNSIPPNLFA